MLAGSTKDRPFTSVTDELFARMCLIRLGERVS
jgi:hypothetical protein